MNNNIRGKKRASAGRVSGKGPARPSVALHSGVSAQKVFTMMTLSEELLLLLSGAATHTMLVFVFGDVFYLQQSERPFKLFKLAPR